MDSPLKTTSKKKHSFTLTDHGLPLCFLDHKNCQDPTEQVHCVWFPPPGFFEEISTKYWGDFDSEVWCCLVMSGTGPLSPRGTLTVKSGVVW